MTSYTSTFAPTGPVMATLKLKLERGVLVTRPVQANPVLARPVLGRRTICKSAFAQELLPRVQELPLTFTISNYDEDQAVGSFSPLSGNKKRLALACDANGIPRNQKLHALMLAMAMQETTHMDVRQRDATKDNDPKGRNATIFNLSADLIEKTGYFGAGNFQVLTEAQWHLLTTRTASERDEGLIAAVGILKSAFEKFDRFNATNSIENTLAFVRAGGSAFDPNRTDNWRKFVEGKGNRDNLLRFVEGYMVSIKTYLRYIDQDPRLFMDKRRPDIRLDPINDASLTQS